jgi:hypothetical protein
MSTLTAQRIRILALASVLPVKDQLTNGEPRLVRGAQISIEVGLATARDTFIDDAGNLASVVFTVRNLNANKNGPGTTVLISADTNVISDATDATSWKNFTSQNAQIIIDTAESAVAAGEYWFTLTALTTDDPAHVIPLAAGRCAIVDSGYDPGASPPAPIELYVTVAAQTAALTAAWQRTTNTVDGSGSTAIAWPSGSHDVYHEVGIVSLTSGNRTFTLPADAPNGARMTLRINCPSSGSGSIVLQSGTGPTITHDTYPLDGTGRSLIYECTRPGTVGSGSWTVIERRFANVAAASTTAPGVVRLSTSADQAAFAQGVVLDPHALRAMLLNMNVRSLAIAVGGSASVTGNCSAQGGLSARAFTTVSPFAANSTYVWRESSNSHATMHQIGGFSRRLDWSRPGMYSFLFGIDGIYPATVATGWCRFGLGRPSAAGMSFVRDITTLGSSTLVAVEFDGGPAPQLYLAVANGTTGKRAIATGFTASETTKLATVVWDGVGNAHLFVDGVLAVSTDGAPTILSLNQNCSFTMEGTNGSDTSATWGFAIGGHVPYAFT